MGMPSRRTNNFPSKWAWPRTRDPYNFWHTIQHISKTTSATDFKFDTWIDIPQKPNRYPITNTDTDYRGVTSAGWFRVQKNTEYRQGDNWISQIQFVQRLHLCPLVHSLFYIIIILWPCRLGLHGFVAIISQTIYQLTNQPLKTKKSNRPRYIYPSIDWLITDHWSVSQSVGKFPVALLLI